MGLTHIALLFRPFTHTGLSKASLLHRRWRKPLSQQSFAGETEVRATVICFTRPSLEHKTVSGYFQAPGSLAEVGRVKQSHTSSSNRKQWEQSSPGFECNPWKWEWKWGPLWPITARPPSFGWYKARHLPCDETPQCLPESAHGHLGTVLQAEHGGHWSGFPWCCPGGNVPGLRSSISVHSLLGRVYCTHLGGHDTSFPRVLHRQCPPVIWWCFISPSPPQHFWPLLSPHNYSSLYSGCFVCLGWGHILRQGLAVYPWLASNLWSCCLILQILGLQVFATIPGFTCF